MEIGEVVVCLDNVSLNGEVEYPITIGNNYSVYRTYPLHITVIDDNYLPGKYSRSRFKLLSDIREEKLDSIINKSNIYDL